MRKKSKSGKKSVYTVCIIVTLVFFAIFAARLIDWQIIHGEEYKNLAARSTSYTVSTDAIRGEILDKNGTGLVVNTTHYKVVIDKLYVDEDKLDDTILSLIIITEQTKEKWADNLPIDLNANGKFQYKKSSEDDVQKLLAADFLNLPEQTDANECLNALAERYKISGNYAKTDLRNLVSVHYNMEITGYSGSKPYVFAEDISQNSVSAISESTQGVSGVEVQTYLERSAANPELAPHLLGALGSMSEDEYNELGKSIKKFTLSDKVRKFDK